MKAAPFVKWVGGKSTLAPIIASRYLPKKIDTYFEPFLGGGAVFFWLANNKQFRRAVLSDICVDLINAYSAIKADWHDVSALLRWHTNRYAKAAAKSMKHAEAYYMRCRGEDASKLDNAQRAARFIMLNKTGFNGLYRVNKSGQFNVPFGKHESPKLYDPANLDAVSRALRNVELHTMDFADALDLADAGDAVYLDPPYFPIKADSFVSYSAGKFDRSDQARLLRAYRCAAARGVALLETNSDVPQIRKAYGAYTIHKVAQWRGISAKPIGRKRTNDLLIMANCGGEDGPGRS